MRIKFLMVLPVVLVLFLSCETERQRPVPSYTMGDPVDSGSRFPFLTTDNSGRVFMSWISGIDEEMYVLEYASFEGVNWNDAQAVRVNTDFFVNWADFPSIVTWDGEPVAIHWLKKNSRSTHAYDIQIAFQSENGRWDTVVSPHDDGTATEHGFVSMVALGPDRVLVIWLDGRQMEGMAADEYGDLNRSMTLRSAEISSDGSITREQVIDARVCDCCQTDLVLVEGGAIAVYRDRSEDEVRDISLVRYDLETGAWTDPMTVHEDGWQIMACPVNGPQADILDNRVAVTWYTGADDEDRVMLAMSDNSGASFGEPVRIDNGNTMGRSDVKFRDDGTLYASWMERGEDFAFVNFREISQGGEPLPAIHIGTVDNGSQSGFPRMAMSENGIIFAWSQTRPFIRVRNAYFPF